MERLQKYLARCGIASRRKSEELIASGKVKVNGLVITEMGYKISDNDVVLYNDKEVKPTEFVYVLMNKPRYIICSANDEHDRKTVIDILPNELKEYRLFPVGRLDYDTKGALLLTNDGEMMNRLVGPKSNTEKEYLARVKGICEKSELAKMAHGLKIDNYVTRPCKVFMEDVDKKNNSCLLHITINEGKNHQVKNMCSAIDHEVKNLTRIRFANLTLEGLPEGDCRYLSAHEIKQLYAISLQTLDD